MTNFQYIVLAIFAVAIVGGVIVFATFGGGGSGGPAVTVSMWGTIPKNVFDGFISDLKTKQGINLLITYTEKSETTFDRDFIEALAKGQAPDIVFLPVDRIIRHADKIYPIPYGSITERAFKDAFIQEGELYLTKDGVLGIPFTVDPLVMYWNRDIFSSAKVAQPPVSWDQFISLAGKIDKKDESGNLTRSLVALGEFANVAHAKEILATLILQAGNPIISRDQNGILQASLDQRVSGATLPPTEAALTFFTEFSNPAKAVYSWNRALPQSRDAFTAGDLAIYIGYASELSTIRSKNPNLNFDVAFLPQPLDAATDVTFGKMEALSIVNQSPNKIAALSTIVALSRAGVLSALSELLNLPPVRRDLLAKPAPNAFQSVFYNSALSARAWLDPSPSETATIFRSMVENVTTGRAFPAEAVGEANGELRNLLNSQ